MRSGLSRKLAFSTVLLMSTSVSGFTQTHQEGLARTIEPVIMPTSYKNRGDGVLWQGQVESAQSKWIRIHFADINSPPGTDYKIVLRDKTERAVKRYTATE